MRRQCSDGDGYVDAGSHKNRALHANEREQQTAAHQTGSARPERIDVIEQAHGGADLPGALNKMRNQNWQGGAHQQRRDDDKQQIDSGHGGQRPIDDERADLFKDAQRHNTEGGGAYFDRRQQRQQTDTALL